MELTGLSDFSKIEWLPGQKQLTVKRDRQIGEVVVRWGSSVGGIKPEPPAAITFLHDTSTTTKVNSPVRQPVGYSLYRAIRGGLLASLCMAFLLCVTNSG